jgi:hypothetical protein
MRKRTSSNTSQSKYPFLEATPKGVLIRVAPAPLIQKRVEGIHEGSVKIRLTAPPVKARRTGL